MEEENRTTRVPDAAFAPAPLPQPLPSPPPPQLLPPRLFARLMPASSPPALEALQEHGNALPVHVVLSKQRIPSNPLSSSLRFSTL